MSELVSVTVDETRCVGSGDCVRIAGEAFELDADDGLARVRPGAARADRERLRRAARECPTGAIAIDADED